MCSQCKTHKKGLANLEISRKREILCIGQKYYCSHHTGLRISKEQIEQ